MQLLVELIPVKFVGFFEGFYLSSTLLINFCNFDFASFELIFMDFILIEIEIKLCTHALILLF